MVMIHGVRLLYCAGGGWCTTVLGAAGVSQDFTPPSESLLGRSRLAGHRILIRTGIELYY